MSFGKISYCGNSHFSHRYCDTFIKYIFIGFDDISTEYPKNCVEWTEKGANAITFHQLPEFLLKKSNHQNSHLS